MRERSAREGNRSRGGNANFCRILSFPLLKRCLSRIKPTPPTLTKNKKRKQYNHHRFRLVQNMNYFLIPALISASSSEVISFVMFLATVLLYLFSPIFVYIFALRGNQFALRGNFSHNIVIATLRKPNNPSGLKLRRGYYTY